MKSSPTEVSNQIEEVPVHEVPKDKLFQLSKPVQVDDGEILLPGDYVIVRNIKTLRTNFRVLFETLAKENPSIAYVTMRINSKMYKLLLLHNGPLDGHGECISAGNGVPESGTRTNIAPSVFSGEHAPHITKQAKELPLDTTLVAAAVHQIRGSEDSDDIATLHSIPTMENAVSTPLVDSMVIYKGEMFTLNLKDDQLVLSVLGDSSDNKECDSNSLIIDPESELIVYDIKTEPQNSS